MSVDLAFRCLGLKGGPPRQPDDPGLSWDCGRRSAAGFLADIECVADGLRDKRLHSIPARRTPESVTQVLAALAAGVAFTPMHAPVHIRVPDGTAYVLPTSGTTGRPNSVVVNVAGLRHVFGALRAELSDLIPAQARWTHAHPLTFGFSMCEILGAITFGGEIAVVPGESPFSGGQWRRAVAAADGPVVACVTPSELSVLCGNVGYATGDHPIYLILSGEPAHRAPLEELLSRAPSGSVTVINTYAAAETSGQIAIDVVTARTVRRTMAGYVGKPLGGVRVSIGDAGEIAVWGPTLATGYLDARATRARFPGAGHERRFLTRDVGRWAQDGGLVVDGRASRVVKLAGQWLNLDEAERRLGALAEVRDVACALHTTGSLQVLLVAVVPRDPRARHIDLRRAVVSVLEARASVQLRIVNELPRTPNGKLDLTAVQTAAASQPVDLGRTILSVWEGVLGAGIQPDGDLFSMGVDSLGVTAVAARLSAATGLTVTAEFLLARPTLAGQITALADAQHRQAPHRQAPQRQSQSEQAPDQAQDRAGASAMVAISERRRAARQTSAARDMQTRE